MGELWVGGAEGQAAQAEAPAGSKHDFCLLIYIHTCTVGLCEPSLSSCPLLAGFETKFLFGSQTTEMGNLQICLTKKNIKGNL